VTARGTGRPFPPARASFTTTRQRWRRRPTAGAWWSGRHLPHRYGPRQRPTTTLCPVPSCTLPSIDSAVRRPVSTVNPSSRMTSPGTVRGPGVPRQPGGRSQSALVSITSATGRQPPAAPQDGRVAVTGEVMPSTSALRPSPSSHPSHRSRTSAGGPPLRDWQTMLAPDLNPDQGPTQPQARVDGRGRGRGPGQHSTSSGQAASAIGSRNRPRKGRSLPSCDRARPVGGWTGR
jgi:hypothetical protein